MGAVVHCRTAYSAATVFIASVLGLRIVFVSASVRRIAGIAQGNCQNGQPEGDLVHEIG